MMADWRDGRARGPSRWRRRRSTREGQQLPHRHAGGDDDAHGAPIEQGNVQRHAGEGVCRQHDLEVVDVGRGRRRRWWWRQWRRWWRRGCVAAPVSPNTKETHMSVTLDYALIELITGVKRTLDTRQQPEKPESRPPRAAHGLKIALLAAVPQNECHEARARTTPLARYARVFSTCHGAGARNRSQDSRLRPWSTMVAGDIRP
jgi:hypothetical protein